MGVPKFPDWAPVDKSTQIFINVMSSRYRVSDFNFTNLYAWDLQQGCRVSDLYGNLALMLNDYISGESLFSFLGDNLPKTTARTLLDYSWGFYRNDTLRLIPSIAAESLIGCTEFVVTEDVDNHDYVLDLSAIVRMSGKEFMHLRGLYNQFARLYSDTAHFGQIDIYDILIQDMIFDVFERRESLKRLNSYDNEYKALKRLLEAKILPGFYSYGLEIKGRLVAFIIIEPYYNDWAVAHFWKADTAYKGAYGYFIHHVARDMLARGYTKLNFEQDLGIEGLRQAKHLLRPAHVLKKYTVSRVPIAGQSVPLQVMGQLA